MSTKAKLGYALAGFIGGNLILVACVGLGYMLIRQETREMPEISLETAIELIESKRVESIGFSEDRAVISVSGEDRMLHLKSDASKELIWLRAADARIAIKESGPPPSFGWTLVSIGWMIVPSILVLLTISIALLAFSIYYSSRNSGLPR
jgi:hypothetical protein